MITELDAVLPPDSNLTSIELELVSWKVVTDVTGDKKIMKKIKKVGEGFDRPNEGSQVKGKLYLKNLMLKTTRGNSFLNHTLEKKLH